MASAGRIVITYDDGSSEEFNPNRPRLLLNMEKKFGVQAPEKHEQLFWIAWQALAPEKPFDEWVDTVADMDATGIATDQGGQGKVNS